MRLLSRLLLAAACAALPAALALMSCGSDAVGVDACRQIEEARCQVAPFCSPGFDVDRCTRFYRDECLVGIQNTVDPTDPNTQAAGCVAAINAVAACIADGGPGSDDTCTAAALAPDASCAEATSGDPTGCNVLLHCPEALDACSFVLQPPDAGADADAAAAADADAAADAADATDAASE